MRCILCGTNETDVMIYGYLDFADEDKVAVQEAIGEIWRGIEEIEGIIEHGNCSDALKRGLIDELEKWHGIDNMLDYFHKKGLKVERIPVDDEEVIHVPMWL